LLFSFTDDSLAQSEEIKAIEVRSVWTGLGPTGESRLIIKRKKHKFFSKDKQVQNELIDHLLQELHLSVDSPTLQNLGISESWLQTTAESALPNRLKNAQQNEKDLYVTSYKNLDLIGRLLPQIIGGGWTDDFPRFEMRIRKRDGSLTEIKSKMQGVFMIPLAIVENGDIRTSYNANLSRAIAALLPDSFTNRDRLSGERLSGRVADRVMLEFDDELNRLETRNRIGPELKRLEGRYTVKKTAISRLLSVDVGTIGETFPRWNAELYRNDVPRNVFIGVSLPFENDKLTNFDVFLNKIDPLVDLPMSVPWLSKYVSDHPDTQIEVRFVTDRSMSPKAFDYFLETMKALEAEPLARDIQARIPESAFVEIYAGSKWSRWIILSDHRMVLFNFEGDTVLKWRSEDFTTRIRYANSQAHMAKAMISPTGEIISK